MDTEFDEYERRLWTNAADAFSRSFAKLCGHTANALLDAARVTAGTRVLDVGTGSGTVAALASARAAVVTAVDAEPSMVALAARNVPGAYVTHAVLPRLGFDDGSFDAVVANFVLNHVGDPAVAMAELVRVLDRGGLLAVTIWPLPAPPLQRLWHEIISELPPGPAVPTVASELNFERSLDGLRDVFGQAGLTDIEARTLEWRHETTVDEWWIGPANGLGTLGHMLTRQPPTVVAHARRQYERIVRPYDIGDGRLSIPTAALLAVGRR